MGSHMKGSQDYSVPFSYHCTIPHLYLVNSIDLKTTKSFGKSKQTTSKQNQPTYQTNNQLLKRTNERTNKQTNKQTNNQPNRQHKQTTKPTNQTDSTNKQTNKHTNKQTNKQTSKQANKQTNKQANKQTSKQTNKQQNNKTHQPNRQHKTEHSPKQPRKQPTNEKNTIREDTFRRFWSDYSHDEWQGRKALVAATAPWLSGLPVPKLAPLGSIWT